MKLDSISPTAAEAIVALFILTVHAGTANQEEVAAAADRLVGYDISLDLFASIYARTMEDIQSMGVSGAAQRVAAPLRLHLSVAIRDALLTDLSRTAATTGIAATAAEVLTSIRDAWQ